MIFWGAINIAGKRSPKIPYGTKAVNHSSGSLVYAPVFLLLPCTILHLLTQFGFLGLSYCRSFCRRGQPEESNHNSSSKKLHGEWFFLYMVWFVISKKKKKKVNKNKNKTKEKKRKDKFGIFFKIPVS